MAPERAGRRDPRHDILFEPVQIGPKTLRNRFYQTAHCTGFGSDLPGTQAYLRGVKAEGGWAAVTTEYCSIHPESDSTPRALARMWDNSDVRNLALMCEKVHEQGSLAGIELGYHASLHTGYYTRAPSRGPSQLASRRGFSCRSMDKAEIRELQDWYVHAAVRSRAAGFDIVNIAGAEAGGVMMQSLMRSWNTREDEYGGAFANRARFWLETLEKVKDAVGDDCALVARLCIDTLHTDDSGIRVDHEGVGFISLADELVDLWDVQVGGRDSEEWSSEDARPSRFGPQNAQQAWVQRIRPFTTKPIVGVGRFTSPDVMAEAIRTGQLDIIGAARPSIADPFLPRKIEEGRVDDIRECIGCNMCASRFNQAAFIVCTQNATLGEEYRRGWHPERFSRARNNARDVLIVGAGPAGLECARVLGERGMRRVHLVEAGDDVGGALRWMTRFRGLGEWGRVIDYRKIQISKLNNIEVLTRSRLTAAEILDYGAELIVFATGAYWAADGLNPVTRAPIPGADAAQAHVLTPEQVMGEGKAPTGSKVVVYDTDGYFVGPSIAEKLALDKYEVMFVTPEGHPTPFMQHTGEGPHMIRSLVELGVEIKPLNQVVAVDTSGALIRSVYDPSREELVEADSVVLVTQRLSRDKHYHLTVAERDRFDSIGIEGVFRVGDCMVPRTIADSVFDGHRLAREIDSPDPAIALPFIREQRRLGSADDGSYDTLLVGRGVEDVSSVLNRLPAPT